MFKEQIARCQPTSSTRCTIKWPQRTFGPWKHLNAQSLYTSINLNIFKWIFNTSADVEVPSCWSLAVVPTGLRGSLCGTLMLRCPGRVPDNGSWSARLSLPCYLDKRPTGGRRLILTVQSLLRDLPLTLALPLWCLSNLFPLFIPNES